MKKQDWLTSCAVALVVALTIVLAGPKMGVADPTSIVTVPALPSTSMTIPTINAEVSATTTKDHGQISRVVMMYQPNAGPLVTPIYTQFLSVLNKDVDIIWVVGHQPDLADLKTRLGAAWPAASSSVVVDKDISTWCKDRFIAMHYPGVSGKGLLGTAGVSIHPGERHMVSGRVCHDGEREQQCQCEYFSHGILQKIEDNLLFR